MNVEVFGNSSGQAEVDAILQFVADLEYAQQNELPDAFMKLFSKNDPVWTTGHGKRLSGWHEISEFTHKVLPGAMKESTASYQVARILFLRPDVAVVNVHQKSIYLDGRAIEDMPEGRPIYILHRDEDAWKLAAAQNTQVHV